MKVVITKKQEEVQHGGSRSLEGRCRYGYEVSFDSDEWDDVKEMLESINRVFPHNDQTPSDVGVDDLQDRIIEEMTKKMSKTFNKQ